MTSFAILDGNQRSALAATRALGRAGFTVHVGDCLASLAGASRYAAGHFKYADPTQETDQALNDIRSYLRAHKITQLLPITDVTSHLILAGLTCEDGINTPCPPLALYEHASDKGRLVHTAQRCGVPTPASQLIDSAQPLTALPKGFAFPVVLKPTRSRIATNTGYISTTVKVAHSSAEFIALQRDNAWFGAASWLLQSFIDGTGQGVFSIYDDGRPVAWFAHERIREKPPTGGVSVLSRSAPLSPRLKEAAKKLLDALDWHGPAMVEFRVTPDGTPYLMEINARFWGSLQLAVSSGVNFPLLAAQIAMGEHPKPVEDYKLGVYNRWLLGDLDNLYLTLKAPRRDFSLGQKLAAVGKFMIPWWPGLHYEVNQWGDMGPFWHELKHYLR